jgi:hypothetical protein
MLINAKIADEQIEQLTREERFNNKVQHAIKMGEREFSFNTEFNYNSDFRDSNIIKNKIEQFFSRT